MASRVAAVAATGREGGGGWYKLPTMSDHRRLEMRVCATASAAVWLPFRRELGKAEFQLSVVTLRDTIPLR